jgi:hypothetical protein
MFMFALLLLFVLVAIASVWIRLQVLTPPS